MTAPAITFLVAVMKWLELEDGKRLELLDKMECFAECLTRIIRHMSISCMWDNKVP